jgi:hypothetical protein
MAAADMTPQVFEDEYLKPNRSASDFADINSFFLSLEL